MNLAIRDIRHGLFRFVLNCFGLGLLMTVVLAMIGIYNGLVIAHIIYTMTMEKLKQIATLKLIGAPDRTIIGLIVQQALIFGASGLGIGLMLILLVKDNFPRRVVLEPFNALVLAGIILVVCLVASGLGVRAAMKVDPRHGTRGLRPWRRAMFW